MRFRTFFIFIACFLSQAAGVYAHAQTPHPGSERITFDSADMKDEAPVKLSGWWIKSAQNGRRPAIIALHGCGGLYGTRKTGGNIFNARHAAMANLLHAAGYHVFFPDSFTARGKRSICSEKIGERDLTSANRRGDVQGALQWLAQQPEVDVSRIALLGWSHGGSTVLSAVNAARKDATDLSVQPKAAVAFYPGCSAYANQRTPYRLAVPLLILMGENDDWTPPAPCIALAKQLQETGAPVTLRLYPDSYHDFDAPDLPLRVRRDIPNGVRPGAGVTTGGNPAARTAAYQEMLEFLSRQLE